MKQTFGEFIRKERLDRMIKLNVFAKTVGISNVYQSYIESGKRPAPSKPILEKMAEVLNLNDREIQTMNTLASLSRAKDSLPENLDSYILERPYITETLLTAKKNDTPEAEWVKFKNKIDLYSVIKRK